MNWTSSSRVCRRLPSKGRELSARQLLRCSGQRRSTSWMTARYWPLPRLTPVGWYEGTCRSSSTSGSGFLSLFDRVRRAVDAGASANSFLLTGSATPKDPPTHSGAGRIVRVRLRPMTLAERGISRPTVSLRRLLGGNRGPVAGGTQTGLEDYVHEILRSGLPGLLPLRGPLLRARLDGYLDGIVDHDFEELGQTVRRPQLLRRWMAAYAAATSTVASYEKIRDAAEGGSERPPSRSTAHAYRDALERLFILDPVPAWLPTTNRFAHWRPRRNIISQIRPSQPGSLASVRRHCWRETREIRAYDGRERF